jgi:hypothetical protein
MSKVLLSRQSLAERWDFSSASVIAKYEADGIINRVKGIPTPRYSLDEIEKIELIGDVSPLSPIERRKLERKIEKLEAELEQYKRKFEIIKSQVT